MYVDLCGNCKLATIARGPPENWPTKPMCTHKKVVIAAIKLSDLVEIVEDADSEYLDLGTDGSSSEEKCEDTENLPRPFTSAVRCQNGPLPKKLFSALKTL